MHVDDCIFCKLANGQIPTELLYEDEQVACFRDTNPQTEVHLLLLPKKHYRDIQDLAQTEEGREDAAALLAAIPQIASRLGLSETGFRVINNCGKGAGQSVFHVHFHIMSDPAKLQDRLV